MVQNVLLTLPNFEEIKLREQKELSLTCYQLEYYQYDSVLEFLKIHANFLKSLQLGYEFLVSINELVNAKLQKLKKLCLEPLDLIIQSFSSAWKLTEV